MDYEKIHELSLELGRKLIQENPELREWVESKLPELREINEEEIRKDIIGGLMWQRDNLKSEGPHDNNLILPGFCLNVGKHLAYLEKQKEQKPAEWSEEDEKHTNSILERLEGMCKKGATFTQTRFAVSEDEDWLKSLPERFNLQPKQEWNEKDKKILQSLHHVMNCADAQNAVKRDGLRVEDVCTFLFSIKPSWKPSEEQMSYLSKAIKTLGEEGDCRTAAILNEIRLKLEKL